jgi:hypothetical protein
MKRLGMPTKPITPVVLSGLGSAGLNTQSQDATLGPEWLTAADNVVFDYQGRISSRKGIKQVSKTIGSSIKSIGCYIKADRTREYYAGAGNAIYKLDTTVTPYSLTSQAFSGTPQTIINGNWQWVNFNDEFWGVQSSHKVVNFDGTNWYDMEDLGTYLAPVGITTFDPSCALGDFGRMWYGGVTEAPGVVFYSDNLIGEALSGGASGIVDLKTVWGNDEVVGLGSIENKLIIFGKQNIVIYTGADDPANMVLDEVIKGIGLAGRDNISYVNTDIIFMSYEGLRSLTRTVQNDGKSPIDDLSLAIRNDLTRLLASADLTTVKSSYYPEDGIIVTFFPGSLKCYVFDMILFASQNRPRITTWSFTSAPLCGLGTIDGTLYLGLSDSVAEYSDYYDVTISDVTGTYGNQSVCEAANNTWETSTCWSYTNNNYNYTWQSAWLDLNNPVIAKIVKAGLFTFVGGRGATSEIFIYKDYDSGSPYSKSFSLTTQGTTYLYGKLNSLYGAAIYASPSTAKEYKVPLGRTGRVIRLKMTTEVNGNYSSLVNTTLLTKQGKIR